MQQKVIKNISIDFLPLEKGQVEFRGLYLVYDRAVSTVFELIALISILQSFISSRLRSGDEYKIGDVVLSFVDAEKTLSFTVDNTFVHLNKPECLVIQKVCEKVASKASLSATHKTHKHVMEVSYGH